MYSCCWSNIWNGSELAFNVKNKKIENKNNSNIQNKIKDRFQNLWIDVVNLPNLYFLKKKTKFEINKYININKLNHANINLLICVCLFKNNIITMIKFNKKKKNVFEKKFIKYL